MTGIIGRFTEIDSGLPWFDLENLDEADESRTGRISIPENLRPNYKPYHFRMDCRQHIFVFEQYGYHQALSPKQVLKMMRILVSDDSVIENFGLVEVSLIQTEEALDEILSLEQLKRLKIVYQLPNPDDLARFESTMQRRLSSQHVRKITVELEADATRKIIPDEENLKLARSALRNGEVEGVGYRANGEFARLRSEEHPRLETVSYDPDNTSDQQAFLRAANRFGSGD